MSRLSRGGTFRLLAVPVAVVALVVAEAAPAVALSQPKPKITLSVTSSKITALVSGDSVPTAPSGTVEFDVDGTKVGSADLVAPSDPTTNVATAVLKYHVKTGKTRTITAKYSDTAALPVFADATKSIKRRDPSISARLTSKHRISKYGWYRTNVRVVFHCTKHGSPIKCPAPLVFSKSGRGQSGRATTYAANGGAATVRIKNINIDKVKPKVTLTTSGGKLRCEATDKLSGVASCTVHRSTSHGVHHYRVVAVDKAGNRRVLTGRL